MDITSIWRDVITKKLNDTGWVQIRHGTPDDRCAKCKTLNNCLFAKDKMPTLPVHPHCHCYAENAPKPISGVTATAEGALSKFEDYVFHPDIEKNLGKKDLFEGWGYGKIDSAWLLEEFKRQALKKYCNGEYTLGKFNDFGQRISIGIELQETNGLPIHFKSGWMVRSNGKIELTTPFGGWIT